MKKLEATIIDIFDDVNLTETMQKIAHRIPTELKKVDIPSMEDRNSLEDHDFALSIFTKNANKINKFPINNPINTVLSDQYFNLNHGKLPGQAQNIAATYIKQACDRFGLQASEGVKLAASIHPTMTNIYFEKINDKPGGSLLPEEALVADSEFYYALTKTAGDGSITRKYKMPNQDGVRAAAEYFNKYARQFAPEDRHQFASNVVKRAEELGMVIDSPAINKYAGLGYNDNVGGYLSIRRKLVEGQATFTEALDKLASYQSKTDPVTFAKVLHELDKRAGLDRYYDTYLADPYASTFKQTLEKKANVIFSLDHLLMSESDLEKVAKDKYKTLKNYFGSTLADGLKKEGASAFIALPEDAKEIIARIANGEIQ